jgi:MoxR-like ATPase
MAKESFAVLLDRFCQAKKAITNEISKAIVGQAEVVDQILASILSRGHCLLVGVPGLAKTLLVSTIAQITSMTFKRVQFTPDLMPSDITGTNVIDEVNGKREFRFVRGPVFANIILADEINRTPPKTQASLLESMQERQVSVGQETYPLPNPFFVIATQNPIEQEGTYPLPEAQLDRFMFNIFVDYPSRPEEERILATTTGGRKPVLHRILNDRQILNMQKLIASIPISDYVISYVASLVRATRPKDETSPDYVKRLVEWGAGPRAGQYLILGGKAAAAMDGRFTVSTDDIRNVALPVLRHRIGCNFAAQAEGVTPVELVRKLLETIQEPEVAKYASKQAAQQAQQVDTSELQEVGEEVAQAMEAQPVEPAEPVEPEPKP